MSSEAGITKWPKIYLFGDSLTQFALSKSGGWASLIGDHFQRRCDVIVRGFSGYSTRHCKHILPKILDKEQAEDIVAMVILLGTNDANLAEISPVQHVPMDEYKDNLKWLVDYCKSVGVGPEKILVITPPPVDIKAWMDVVSKNGWLLSLDVETSSKYSMACKEAASDIGVTCIDVYGEMMKAKDYSKYLYDGLHFGEAGAQLVFDLLLPALERLTSRVPPLLFPDLADIDIGDLEKSFSDWKKS